MHFLLRRLFVKRFSSFVLFFALSGLALESTAQTAHGTYVPDAASVAIFGQGTAALRAHQPDEAIAAFTRLTEKAPRFAEAYLNLGLAFAEVSRNEEAVKALERCIALKPTLRGAHLFLAISQYKLSLFEPAARAIRKETALSSADAQAWMWQGIIDLSLGDLTNGVEALDHAARLDPQNVDILYHRGRAALALSRASYEAMFKADPKSWHIHQVLAESDVESGHDTEAIDEYKIAIASAPAQSGLYEALGTSLWRVGKYDDAQRAYEDALKVDPNDTLTMYKLGCLRVDLSNPIGGKQLLDRVLVADPTLPMTNYYRGRAELQLGQDAAAVEDFRKTIAQNADDDTTKQAYFQLSRAYRHLNDGAASEQAQVQYRMLDQKSKDAMQEKLSRLRRRADRDTSVPPPPAEAAKPQP